MNAAERDVLSAISVLILFRPSAREIEGLDAAQAR
jgi:hypothetical protein